MGIKDVLKKTYTEKEATDDSLLEFYNKKPSGNEAMDEMNHWFYVTRVNGGVKKEPIRKINASVLDGKKIDSIFDGWGQTLMTSAVINGRSDLVNFLLKKGACPDARNNLVDGVTQKGQTPIELAKDRARFGVPNAREIYSILKEASQKNVVRASNRDAEY